MQEQITYATYTVTENTWTSRLVSIPLDEPTPIMLANHIYWNLGAFINSQATTVLDNNLHMPFARRMIEIDNIEVPTGVVEPVLGGPFDFTDPKSIGRDLVNAKKCGFNCTGYDNAFVLDRPHATGADGAEGTVLTLSSPETGIQMDLATNQQSLQIYTCGGQDGTLPVKQSQQHDTHIFVPQVGCVSCLGFL